MRVAAARAGVAWEAIVAGRDDAVLWSGVTGFATGEEGERAGEALDTCPAKRAASSSSARYARTCASAARRDAAHASRPRSEVVGVSRRDDAATPRGRTGRRGAHCSVGARRSARRAPRASLAGDGCQHGDRCALGDDRRRSGDGVERRTTGRRSRRVRDDARAGRGSHCSTCDHACADDADAARCRAAYVLPGHGQAYDCGHAPRGRLDASRRVVRHSARGTDPGVVHLAGARQVVRAARRATPRGHDRRAHGVLGARLSRGDPAPGCGRSRRRRCARRRRERRARAGRRRGPHTRRVRHTARSTRPDARSRSTRPSARERARRAPPCCSRRWGIPIRRFRGRAARSWNAAASE